MISLFFFSFQKTEPLLLSYSPLSTPVSIQSIHAVLNVVESPFVLLSLAALLNTERKLSSPLEYQGRQSLTRPYKMGSLLLTLIMF